MAQHQELNIQTRLGRRQVNADKVISFPRGLMGFEKMRSFVLLEIQEGLPLLLLQSTEDEKLGLLVADPYRFLPDFRLKIGDAEQSLLQVAGAADLSVLVTVSIPVGQPENTTLNLAGPILINHVAHIGLQVPQTEGESPSRVLIHLRK